MKSNFYFFNKYRKCFINVILVFTTMIMFCQEIYIYTCIHCRFFIVCIYMFCYWRSSYQEGREAIPLIGLIQVHICACLKPGPGFLTSYVMVCFVFSELRWEVIVRYVAICGMFCFSLDFGTVLTVWDVLFFIRFWNCSDCWMFCFSLDFGTVLTLGCFVFH